jgi:DNA-binding NtrC family response regulator
MSATSERLNRERPSIPGIRPDLVVPMREVERQHFESALILCGGDVVLAAERLGVSKNTLYRRMAEIRAEEDDDLT